MARRQNPKKGARRETVPRRRKLPVTADDLSRIYNEVDWGNPDSVAIRCEISIAWFPMLHMGEHIEKTTQKGPNKDNIARPPLLTDEIEPLKNGMMAEWAGAVNEIAIYHSPPKAGWLNERVVTSRNLIREGK